MVDISETTIGAEADLPIIQLCIDVLDPDEAIGIGEMGLRAGVDWLEIGTPLISFAGIANLSAFAEHFRDTVKFLDPKVMDGAGRYMQAAAEMGVTLVAVCASASDATFRAAIRVGREVGVKVVGDLYAHSDPYRRAAELAEMGVDLIYIHYGFDENSERSDADPSLTQLLELKRRISVPIGIVTSSTEMAVEATRAGADILLVSHPFLVGPKAEEKLTDYVRSVRSARQFAESGS